MLLDKFNIDLLNKIKYGTSFEQLNIKILRYKKNRNSIALTMDVENYNKQYMGIVHGGIYAFIAESAASILVMININSKKYFSYGIEINANHIKKKKFGQVIAKPYIIYHGSNIAVCNIHIEDENNLLLSIARCTLNIRKIY